MARQDEPGPVCLYKNGEARTFEGGEIDIALSIGWLDHPVSSMVENLPETVTGEAAAAEAAAAEPPKNKNKK